MQILVRIQSDLTFGTDLCFFKDSLPVISGDMMLPGPISSTGDSNFSGATTLVEGCSTISNLSIMSQPGSVEHIPRSLSPVQNMGTNTSSQDNLDSSTPMIGRVNTTTSQNVLSIIDTDRSIKRNMNRAEFLDKSNLF